MSNDLIYRIAISKIPKVGAVTARTLIGYCGSVENVFRAKKKDLLKIPNIGETIARNILSQDVLRQAAAEIEFIEKYKIQPIFYLDKNYPARLKHYNDAPLMLFYKGTSDLNHVRIVGIVGTRKPSERGKAICEEIVEDLKPYNVVIISGLAYGIDITAHRKSVDLGIETIGTLGHGLDRIYPAAHKKTAEKMVKCGGLLTEFTSGTQPHHTNFPARNRIIAGLSDVLIVVETARSGGSMITAKMANDYNKDVFAIPGRVKDKKSEGCNLLIKSHRANLMDSVEDIKYIMRWETEEPKAQQRSLFVELSEIERKIVEALRGKESVPIDDLVFYLKLSPSVLSINLLNLEFQGVIKTLPGKRYMLI
ncbi:MAG: DNA-processing protein DprA [Saprospiraceae bacterium]